MPTWGRAQWSAVENDTLRLLQLFAEAAQCDRLNHVPVEMQAEVLCRGVKAAEKGITIATRLGDRALCAVFVIVLARGHLETSNWEEARRCYERALEIYRELAKPYPEIYKPSLPVVLHNLGAVLHHMNDVE